MPCAQVQALRAQTVPGGSALIHTFEPLARFTACGPPRLASALPGAAGRGVAIVNGICSHDDFTTLMAGLL